VEEARASDYRACKVCRPDEESETLLLTRYSSPLGTYILISSQKGVCYLTPEDEEDYFARWQRNRARLEEDAGQNRAAVAELDAYFAGRLQQFTVPLDLRGTDFQRLVWEILRGIPYGVTRSYGQVAFAAGRPQGPRAVGQAIGSNPISIIVPCHRVVGSNGGLTGYGGGLPRKKALLELEKVL
jgi:O-6-methylguanine DNA methyltransferase